MHAKRQAERKEKEVAQKELLRKEQAQQIVAQQMQNAEQAKHVPQAQQAQHGPGTSAVPAAGQVPVLSRLSETQLQDLQKQMMQNPALAQRIKVGTPAMYSILQERIVSQRLMAGAGAGPDMGGTTDQNAIMQRLLASRAPAGFPGLAPGAQPTPEQMQQIIQIQQMRQAAAAATQQGGAPPFMQQRLAALQQSTTAHHQQHGGGNAVTSGGVRMASHVHGAQYPQQPRPLYNNPRAYARKNDVEEPDSPSASPPLQPRERQPRRSAATRVTYTEEFDRCVDLTGVPSCVSGRTPIGTPPVPRPASHSPLP